MGIFGRKKGSSLPSPQPESPPKKVCDHKWTDIQDKNGDCWYMEYDIDGKTLTYTIYQPYVCIHCKARRNIEMESSTVSFSKQSEAYEELEAIKKRYPQIRPRALVEDKINDFQLVDRDYLRYASLVIGRLPISGSNDSDSGITYLEM